MEECRPAKRTGERTVSYRSFCPSFRLFDSSAAIFPSEKPVGGVASKLAMRVRAPYTISVDKRWGTNVDEKLMDFIKRLNGIRARERRKTREPAIQKKYDHANEME